MMSNQTHVRFPVKKQFHIQLPTISLSSVFPQFPVAWILPPD